MDETNSFKAYNIIDSAALVCLSFYLFYLCMLNTAMPIELSEGKYSLFIVVFAVLAVLKVYKCIKNKDYKVLSLFSVSFIVSLLSCIYGGYNFIITLSLIMISLYNIDYKNVLEVYLIVAGLVLLLSLVSSAFEIAPNYVSIRWGTGAIRSSWGICFATELAAVFSFLSIYLFAYNDKYSPWFSLIPVSVSFFIAKFISNSRASTITTSIFFVLIVFYCLYECCKKWIKIPKKLVDVLFMSSFFIFALIVFVCIFLYSKNNPLGVELNSLLSSRLGLAFSGAKRYGIHPFGSYFELYGVGDSDKYNFIDISYALIFIRYGWVYFIMVSLLWWHTMKNVLQKGNYKLAVILLVIGINSMVEQHYNEINYNIIFAMPFVNFTVEKKSYKNIKLETAVTGILLVLATVCLYFVGPVILAYGRTCVEIRHLSSINDTRLVLICSFLLLMIGFGIALFESLKYIIINLLLHEKLKRVSFMPIVLCIVLLLVFMLTKDLIKNRTYREIQPVLESEREAINLVIDSKSGKLYSTTLPWFYKEKFNDISYSFYYGEDLAREKNATIIADIKNKYRTFGLNDYKRIQISDYHVIYTNDESVIAAFGENGFSF